MPQAFFVVPGCNHADGRPLHCEYVSVAKGRGNATAELLLSQASAMLHVRPVNVSDLPFKLATIPQVYFNMESSARASSHMDHDTGLEMTYQTCSQVGAGNGTMETLILVAVCLST